MRSDPLELLAERYAELSRRLRSLEALESTPRYLAEVVVSGTPGYISFDNIPQGYRDLEMVIVGRSTFANTLDYVELDCNNDSSGNYYQQQLRGRGTSLYASEAVAFSSIRIGQIPAATASAGLAGVIKVAIPTYSQTTWHKALLFEYFRAEGTGSTNLERGTGGGLYHSTNAITRIDVYPSIGNWSSASVITLRGIR